MSADDSEDEERLPLSQGNDADDDDDDDTGAVRSPCTYMTATSTALNHRADRIRYSVVAVVSVAARGRGPARHERHQHERDTRQQEQAPQREHSTHRSPLDSRLGPTTIHISIYITTTVS